MSVHIHNTLIFLTLHSFSTNNFFYILVFNPLLLWIPEWSSPFTHSGSRWLNMDNCHTQKFAQLFYFLSGLLLHSFAYIILVLTIYLDTIIYSFAYSYQLFIYVNHLIYILQPPLHQFTYIIIMFQNKNKKVKVWLGWLLLLVHVQLIQNSLAFFAFFIESFILYQRVN